MDSEHVCSACPHGEKQQEGWTDKKKRENAQRKSVRWAMKQGLESKNTDAWLKMLVLFRKKQSRESSRGIKDTMV